MKIVVISDLHLTQNFYPKRFKIISEIIDSADQVILNGDFWDAYFIEFDDFVNSKWSALFPLLKKKKTIYLYGNHDRKEDCDDRVFLFCDVHKLSHDINWKDKVLHIEHGNRIIKGLKERVAFLKRYKWIIKRGKPLLKLMDFVWYRLAFAFPFRFESERMKRTINNSLAKANEVYIVGHTHIPYDLDIDSHYINIGNNFLDYSTYLSITEDSIELKHKDF